MTEFAKLFTAADGAQILVLNDVNGDTGQPQVAFMRRAPGLGICSSARLFKDSPEGCAAADGFFASVDETVARKFGEQILAEAAPFADLTVDDGNR